MKAPADPLLLLVRLMTAVTALGLALTGQVSAVLGLLVPPAVLLGWWWQSRGRRPGRAFEILFRLVAFLGLLYFLYLAVGRLRLLAASTALLFIGQAYHSLKPAGRREVWQLQVLAFFQILALAAATTNIGFLLPFLAYLAMAPLALTLIALEGSEGEGRSPVPLTAGLLRASLAASCLALLGAALLFPLLPRYEAGLMSELRQRERRMALSGFSERVRFGDINGIKDSGRLVFRARLEGRVPGEIRWRGIALDHYDGTSWSLSLLDREQVPYRYVRGMTVYRLDEDGSESVETAARIQLEPLFTQVLFHLEGTNTISSGSLRGVSRDDWGNLYSTATRRVKDTYRIETGPPTGTPPLLGEEERARTLQIPPLDPRVEELSRTLAEGTEEPAGLARRIEAHLSTRYDYTLDLDDRGVADPLAAFLLERRSGHCEYFASAMAVMLRVNGVPARLVNGFQQGRHSGLTGTWSVRMRDAHSWVEAWIPGRGWTAFDPTPGEAADERAGLLAYLSDLGELGVTYWDDHVIGYNVYYQINAWLNLRDGLAALAGKLRPHAGVLWAGGGALLAMAAALWAGLALRSRAPAAGSVRVAWMDRLLKRLERRGWKRPQGRTLAEWADDLVRETGPRGEPLRELVRIYYAVRFGGVEVGPDRPAALIQALEPLPRRGGRS